MNQTYNSVNTSLSEVFTPKRQQKLPYEDPKQRERIKNFSIFSAAVYCENIIKRQKQERDIACNIDKMRMYHYFSQWKVKGGKRMSKVDERKKEVLK